MNAIMFLLLLQAKPVVKAEPPKAAKMSELDAARLDASLSHIRELDRAKAEIDKRKNEEVEQAMSALRKYDISPQDFQSGAVTVDFKTGKITRQPPPKK